MLRGLRVVGTATPAALVTQAVIKRAFAQADAGIHFVDVNYLALMTAGGIPRWHFDQFLKIRDSETMTGNPMIVTRFTGSGGTEYATTNHQGVLAPYLWGTSVFNGAGAKRPLTDVLQHMIAFRGYGTGVDGHSSNCARQLAPIPGAGSLTGTFADVSAKTFKALQLPAGQSSLTGYRSSRGTGLTTVTGYGATDSFQDLLRPFDKRDDTKNLVLTRAKYKQYTSEAARIMKAGSYGTISGTDPLRVDHESALKLLDAGLESLGANWTEIFNRYVKLISDTMKDRTVPGISDAAVVTQDNGTSLETDFSLQFPDLNTFPTPGLDLRDVFNAVNVDNLARVFAISEFLFTNGLGGSIEATQLAPENLQLSISRAIIGGVNTPNAPTLKTSSFAFDQHSVGAKSGLYMNTCYFRGLAAGIGELVDKLKAKNVFGNTVIHCTGEFSRTPRESGGGSDHGFDAMSASVFTGRHTGAPVVVGNILQSGSAGGVGANYSGTFGYKAPTKIGVSPAEFLTPANVASSIVSMMKLPENPFGTAAPPLVSVVGNQVKVTTEDPRMV
jgi:hypothetical protein